MTFPLDAADIPGDAAWIRKIRRNRPGTGNAMGTNSLIAFLLIGAIAGWLARG
jgi:hypothetical protein